MLPRASRAMSTTIDLSLERIRKLVSKIPPYTRPTIHITGTNGKGSVASLVSSILHESGLKVGRFNSPHLIEVRDSITIGQKAVPPQLYNQSRSWVERINAGQTTSGNVDIIGASLFEVLTVTALYVFEKEAVDIAVVEVGMGGRLDATNILPDEGVVKVSAMTAVDVDHVRWLGNNISAIAKEKAGIARRGTPFILGPQKWSEVQEVVQEHVERAGAMLKFGAAIALKSTPSECIEYPTHNKPFRPHTSVIYRPFDSNSVMDLELPFPGAHQLDNLSTALGVIERIQEQGEFSSHITVESIRRGVANARWPGRLDYILSTREGTQPHTILADGAHNAASSTALRQYISTLSLTKPSISFIVALSHSPPKTPLDTLGPLICRGDHVAVVSFSPVADMPWVAPEDIRNLQTVCQELVGSDGEIWSSEVIDSDAHSNYGHLLAALDWASRRSDLIVVAGSLYLIADLYRMVDMYPTQFKLL